MVKMETQYWVVDKNAPILTTNPQIQTAALWIRKDEVVAFPTETVYGLGANAYSDNAIAKIFAAKGRPSDNPLIVHISNDMQLKKIVKTIPQKAQQLMDKMWPGPLTIIFKSNHQISSKVTAGLDTVAVRMPDHPVALALVEAAGVPLAAPSANLSGKPSPTTAAHVWHDLNERIAGIIDGGPTGVGLESTVIDCTSQVPLILRPGGVTKEEIEAIIGPVAVDNALITKKQVPKAPGMKYTHYAPEAPLIMVDGSATFIQKLVDENRKQGKKVGVLTTEEQKHRYQADVVVSCGYRNQLDTIAKNLYDRLRYFDTKNVDIIFCEVFPYSGVGEAIMNRLSKAAGGQLMKE